MKKTGKDLAAVIMEPCRGRDPEPAFLEYVRDAVHANGALLIFDEISIGWRLALGGAHLKYGVNPDIAVFAKALSNGYPMSAVIGTKQAMDGAHSSFISSSYWTDGIGPAAALATIRKMRTLDVPGKVKRAGTEVQNIWRRHGERHKLPVVITDRFPCYPSFQFEHELGAELGTLFTQLMLERRFLAGTLFYLTVAHTDEILSRYSQAVEEVFGEIASVITSGNVKSCLKGPVAKEGFARLT